MREAIALFYAQGAANRLMRTSGIAFQPDSALFGFPYFQRGVSIVMGGAFRNPAPRRFAALGQLWDDIINSHVSFP
jgi:hypothetical protein